MKREEVKMKFERRSHYGLLRYYPIDADAHLLISIFRHPPAKTLSQNQYSILKRVGLQIEIVDKQLAKGTFEDTVIDNV